MTSCDDDDVNEDGDADEGGDCEEAGGTAMYKTATTRKIFCVTILKYTEHQNAPNYL